MCAIFFLFAATLCCAAHNTPLLPANQLFVDALRGLLLAHSAGVRLYIGEEIGEMADCPRLGHAGNCYLHLRYGAWSRRLRR